MDAWKNERNRTRLQKIGYKNNVTQTNARRLYGCTLLSDSASARLLDPSTAVPAQQVFERSWSRPASIVTAKQ